MSKKLSAVFIEEVWQYSSFYCHTSSINFLLQEVTFGPQERGHQDDLSETVEDGKEDDAGKCGDREVTSSVLQNVMESVA